MKQSVYEEYRVRNVLDFERETSEALRSRLGFWMKRNKGFTLVELMLVMFIMSLFMYIGIQYFYGVASKAGLKGEEERLCDMLSFARNLALSKNKQASFKFLPTGGTSFDEYTVIDPDSGLDAAERIKVFEGVSCMATAGPIDTANIDEIRFTGRGHLQLSFNGILLMFPTQNAIITLTTKSTSTESRTLIVDAKSGRISR